MRLLAAPPPLRPKADALFLDLDGTLAPIEPRPGDVRPDRRRTQILCELQDRLQGRVAVLTGRTLADVDRILECSVPRVAAIHGLVRREPEGETQSQANLVGLERARRAIASLAAAYEGVLVEDKRLSLAVHWRLAPQWEGPVTAHLVELARQTGLELRPGAAVLELRARGPDKGDSLSDFMRAPPFAGHQPIMVGDDLTDERGFEAAARLGGYGVIVGSTRPTAARYRLADPAEVLAWLQAATAVG